MQRLHVILLFLLTFLSAYLKSGNLVKPTHPSNTCGNINIRIVVDITTQSISTAGETITTPS